MRVCEKRWGEVTIKKQGQKKNDFDKTRSFSIEKTSYPYTVAQLRGLMVRVVNLTQVYSYSELSEIVSELERDGVAGKKR